MRHDREQLRTTFDEVALLYDQARPGYPEQVFDDVISLSNIPPRGRILEIGCGTGKATVPFAQRGYRIRCVELGENLAAVARHNLAAFADVDIYIGAFETWPAEHEAFDLVVAATAWHWVDPAVGFPKAAQVLKPRGTLAIFGSQHVKIDGDRGFFDAVQEVYRREAPELPTDFRLPNPEEIEDSAKTIAASGFFEVVAARRYVGSLTYDAASYIRVLETYSDHRSLPPQQRERLYRGLVQMIDTQAGGRITKGYLTTLAVARRR
ncbi:MAG TPA: class I SAM-dependent methyltransferase [Herpetosiphonaceae bacterium]|nr:class I SAM-dependent methyltransferase [Herpetosiphonaceae bacterium]